MNNSPSFEEGFGKMASYVLVVHSRYSKYGTDVCASFHAPIGCSCSPFWHKLCKFWCSSQSLTSVLFSGAAIENTDSHGKDSQMLRHLIFS